MAKMHVMDQWGPSHQGNQRKRSSGSWRWIVWLFIALAVYGIVHGGTKGEHPATIASGAVILALAAAVTMPASWRRRLFSRVGANGGSSGRGTGQQEVARPLAGVRAAAWRAGGLYLGVNDAGLTRFSRGERAVLLLGPPRSGKTSGVITPAVLSHTGPVVSTSTKLDVAKATRLARAVEGRIWIFDPTGSTPEGEFTLRWSPVMAAGSWDGAQLMARALTTNIGAGTSDRSHWASRAQALIAPMLHAAAVHNKDMATVVDWVMQHELDEPGVLLEDQRCSQLAFSTLLGVWKTEERERSSIFSSAADALQAYASEHALAAARDLNFDPDEFVRSSDTVYVCAPGEAQQAAAPIVCGLLSAIRRSTYRAHAQGQLPRRVLFALDEITNTAPLEELPQIASEGGGQGLLLLAALQDLSQARARWGEQADGFLTLFGTKLILPGIADTKTLESVSTMLGEYDRQVVSHTRQRQSFAQAILGDTHQPARPSSTYSTQRTRVLSPGEIANIPAGRALHLDGVNWELLTLTPAHAVEPWRTLTVLSTR